MAIAEILRASPRFSMKWSSYFGAYEELLERFRGKAVTLVEIGIFSGGSLFMWRQFLGSQARIIGIDLNPECRQLEKDGFEIHIGDQSKPEFWSEFYSKVGDIDVLIDDGGHSNRCQLETLFSSLDHIRDGGLILVEDTHASYMGCYGNPSPLSFINRCKQAVDELNARNPNVSRKPNSLAGAVHSIVFYESMVAFRINRPLCALPELVTATGLPSNAEIKKTEITDTLARKLSRALGGTPGLKRFARWAYFRWENSRLGNYFR